MIAIKSKTDCCGCNACGDVCPKDAITFIADQEGFEYPQVNLDKCIDCHLCEVVCPILNTEKANNNNETPHCFAAIHKNIETRFDSTSGGVFSALADAIYKEGGYVGGAIWDEKNWHVKEYISNNPDDLPRLRSSKYIQSCSVGFYREIKNLLDTDRKVLVCGTPCQMAALRSYLKYKEYENLIIVDFICLGVNSPKVWDSYISMEEEINKGKVVYIKQKNKELGWRNLTNKLVFDNGKVVYEPIESCLFMRGFVTSHAYCRPSCYDCRFKEMPRLSDITLADYWGGEKIVGKELDNNMGTSLVLINNAKGLELYNSVKGKLKQMEVPFESILNGNQALLNSAPKPSFSRELFYEDLDKIPFNEVAQKYHFDSKLTRKKIIKNLIYFWGGIVLASRFNPILYIKNIWYNFIDPRFKTNILNGGFVLINKCVKLNIARSAKFIANGRCKLGVHGYFPTSNLETRIYIGKNGTFIADGEFQILHGCEIQIFDKALIHCKGSFTANIGTNIVCAKKIEFGGDVAIGRYVNIRDNNGNHYIARRGYKNSHELLIGQHCWLCEGCTIIGGAKLGDGVVVGAKAVVMGHFPSYTLLSGNPAQIVDKDIYWKF